MIFLEEKKFFLTSLLLMVITLILSFLGYYFFWFGKFIFILILILTWYFTLKNLSSGLLIALAELFIGSQGHLLSINFFGFELSLRIGIFLVIISVYLIKLLTNKTTREFKQSIFFKPTIIFFIMLGWAMINGLINNQLTNFFFDANAFFFLLYIFIYFDIINNEKIIIKIILLLAAAIIAVGIFTLIYFLIFAYQPPLDLTLIYKWFRDVRLGEITYVIYNIYRIFLQSHIYSLIGFLIFFIFFINQSLIKEKNNLNEKPNKLILLLIIFLASLSTIICFSRSNWLGGITAFIFLLIFLLFNFKVSFKNLIKIISIFLLIIIIDLIFLYIISGNFSPLVIKNRLSNLTEESAGISRLNQLSPLLKNIKDNLVLGAGFGKTITYQTNDPRILKKSPSGWYTTAAFEWGYLDLLLKLGLIGFLIYSYLLYKIFKTGLNLLNKLKEDFQKLLILSLLIGFIGLLITNIFSPYLNHPLGFGYLLLIMAVFNFYEKTKKTTISY